jgi:hypothetical protein
MADYTSIFTEYKTTEGVPFRIFNRRLVFPSDRTHYIYNQHLVTTDVTWTVLSYKIYGTIEYWWILCSLNEENMYYAREGQTITYIKPEYIPSILNMLK